MSANCFGFWRTSSPASPLDPTRGRLSPKSPGLYPVPPNWKFLAPSMRISNLETDKLTCRNTVVSTNFYCVDVSENAGQTALKTHGHFTKKIWHFSSESKAFSSSHTSPPATKTNPFWFLVYELKILWVYLCWAGWRCKLMYKNFDSNYLQYYYS